MNGGYGVRREERFGTASYRNMVGDVFGHVLELERFHVAAADDAGSEGAGGVE